MKINKRHLVKAFSWRLIGSIDTFIFAWFITDNFEEGISISGITTFTKLVWFYIHEQFWYNSIIKKANKRHLYKTFSWRVIGTLDTIVFSWIIIGSPFIGIKIGSAEIFSKMLLYFGHEKLWYQINFGLDRQNRSKRLNKIIEKRNHKN